MQPFVNAFLAWVFLESVASKVRDPAGFRDALAGYRVLRDRPGTRRVAFALTPVVELAAAGLLVVPATGGWATYLAPPLLLVFLVALVADDRPAFNNCGCAGAEPVPVPRRAFVVRTAALLCVALAGVVAAAVGDGGWSAADIALAAAVTFPLAHVALELPLITHVHEVERRHLPDRVAQARRVMARGPEPRYRG